jgi:glycine cleavage system aminomethyltransferase T
MGANNWDLAARIGQHGPEVSGRYLSAEQARALAESLRRLGYDVSLGPNGLDARKILRQVQRGEIPEG